MARRTLFDQLSRVATKSDAVDLAGVLVDIAQHVRALLAQERRRCVRAAKRAVEEIDRDCEGDWTSFAGKETADRIIAAIEVLE